MKKIRKALELSGKTFMPIQKKVKRAILGIDGKTITNPKNSGKKLQNNISSYKNAPQRSFKTSIP